MITAISFKLKFNRKINKDRDYISPGGYEIRTAEGKSVIFDFMDYEGSVKNKVLDCLCRTLDIDSFPKAATLTRGDIANMSAIPEFFVYTGEYDESNLIPKKITELCFSFDDGLPDLRVRDEILVNAGLLCSC